MGDTKISYDLLVPENLVNRVISLVETPRQNQQIVQNLEGKALAYSSYVNNQDDILNALQLRRAALSLRDIPINTNPLDEQSYVGKIFFTPICIFFAPRLPNYYINLGKFLFQNHFNYPIDESKNEAMNFFNLEKDYVAPKFNLIGNSSYSTITQPQPAPAPVPVPVAPAPIPRPNVFGGGISTESTSTTETQDNRFTTPPISLANVSTFPQAARANERVINIPT